MLPLHEDVQGSGIRGVGEGRARVYECRFACLAPPSNRGGTGAPCPSSQVWARWLYDYFVAQELPWHAPFWVGGEGPLERALADILKGANWNGFDGHFLQVRRCRSGRSGVGY